MAVAGQGRRRGERRLLVAAASPRARARTRFLLRFVMTWGTVTLLAILVVSRSAATATADYRTDRLRTQVATLSAVHQSLVAQVEALRAAPRLEKIASASGLVLPQTLVTLPVPPPATTAPAHAAPAPASGRWAAIERIVVRTLRHLP